MSEWGKIGGGSAYAKFLPQSEQDQVGRNTTKQTIRHKPSGHLNELQRDRSQKGSEQIQGRYSVQIKEQTSVPLRVPKSLSKFALPLPPITTQDPRSQLSSPYGLVSESDDILTDVTNQQQTIGAVEGITIDNLQFEDVWRNQINRGVVPGPKIRGITPFQRMRLKTIIQPTVLRGGENETIGDNKQIGSSGSTTINGGNTETNTPRERQQVEVKDDLVEFFGSFPLSGSAIQFRHIWQYLPFPYPILLRDKRGETFNSDSFERFERYLRLFRFRPATTQLHNYDITSGETKLYDMSHILTHNRDESLNNKYRLWHNRINRKVVTDPTYSSSDKHIVFLKRPIKAFSVYTPPQLLALKVEGMDTGEDCDIEPELGIALTPRTAVNNKPRMESCCIVAVNIDNKEAMIEWDTFTKDSSFQVTSGNNSVSSDKLFCKWVSPMNLYVPDDETITTCNVEKNPDILNFFIRRFMSLLMRQEIEARLRDKEIIQSAMVEGDKVNEWKYNAVKTELAKVQTKGDSQYNSNGNTGNNNSEASEVNALAGNSEALVEISSNIPQIRNDVLERIMTMAVKTIPTRLVPLLQDIGLEVSDYHRESEFLAILRHIYKPEHEETRRTILMTMNSKYINNYDTPLSTLFEDPPLTLTTTPGRRDDLDWASFSNRDVHLFGQIAAYENVDSPNLMQVDRSDFQLRFTKIRDAIKCTNIAVVDDPTHITYNPISNYYASTVVEFTFFKHIDNFMRTLTDQGLFLFPIYLFLPFDKRTCTQLLYHGVGKLDTSNVAITTKSKGNMKFQEKATRLNQQVKMELQEQKENERKERQNSYALSMKLNSTAAGVNGMEVFNPYAAANPISALPDLPEVPKLTYCIPIIESMVICSQILKILQFRDQFDEYPFIQRWIDRGKTPIVFSPPNIGPNAPNTKFDLDSFMNTLRQIPEWVLTFPHNQSPTGSTSSNYTLKTLVNEQYGTPLQAAYPTTQALFNMGNSTHVLLEDGTGFDDDALKHSNSLHLAQNTNIRTFKQMIVEHLRRMMRYIVETIEEVKNRIKSGFCEPAMAEGLGDMDEYPQSDMINIEALLEEGDICCDEKVEETEIEQTKPPPTPSGTIETNVLEEQSPVVLGANTEKSLHVAFDVAPVEESPKSKVPATPTLVEPVSANSVAEVTLISVSIADNKLEPESNVEEQESPANNKAEKEEEMKLEELGSGKSQTDDNGLQDRTTTRKGKETKTGRPLTNKPRSQRHETNTKRLISLHNNPGKYTKETWLTPDGQPRKDPSMASPRGREKQQQRSQKSFSNSRFLSSQMEQTSQTFSGQLTSVRGTRGHSDRLHYMKPLRIVNSIAQMMMINVVRRSLEAYKDTLAHFSRTVSDYDNLSKSEGEMKTQLKKLFNGFPAPPYSGSGIDYVVEEEQLKLPELNKNVDQYGVNSAVRIMTDFRTMNNPLFRVELRLKDCSFSDIVPGLAVDPRQFLARQFLETLENFSTAQLIPIAGINKSKANMRMADVTEIRKLAENTVSTSITFQPSVETVEKTLRGITNSILATLRYFPMCDYKLGVLFGQVDDTVNDPSTLNDVSNYLDTGMNNSIDKINDFIYSGSCGLQFVFSFFKLIDNYIPHSQIIPFVIGELCRTVPVFLRRGFRSRSSIAKTENKESNGDSNIRSSAIKSTNGGGTSDSQKEKTDRDNKHLGGQGEGDEEVQEEEEEEEEGELSSEGEEEEDIDSDDEEQAEVSADSNEEDNEPESIPNATARKRGKVKTKRQRTDKEGSHKTDNTVENLAEMERAIGFEEPLNPSLTDFRYLLNRLRHISQLLKAVPKVISINFVSLDVEPIRSRLLHRVSQCFDDVIGVLLLRLINTVIEIEDTHTAVTDKLNHEVKTPEEWEAIQNFTANIKTEVLDSLTLKIRNILTIEEIFSEVCFSIPSTMTNSEAKLRFSRAAVFPLHQSNQTFDKLTIENRILRCRKIPLLISKAIPICRDVLNRKYIMMTEDINNTRLDIYNRIEEYDTRTKQIETKTVLDFRKSNGIDDVYELICSCDKYYTTLTTDIDIFNKHEMIFKIEQTLFPSLKQVALLYAPFHDIWTIAYEHGKCTQEVLIKTFKEINERELEEKTNDWTRECYKVMKSFERNRGKGVDYQNTYLVATEVYRDISEFRTIVPIVLALRNQGMKQRHWDKVNTILGTRLENDDKLTLQVILALLEEKGIDLTDGNRRPSADGAADDSEMAAKGGRSTMDTEANSENVTPRKMETGLAGLDGGIPVPGSQASVCLHAALQRFLPEISSVSEEATKEFQLLTTFKNLEASWRLMGFSSIRYKETESFVIRQTDDMTQQLDDNIILLQTMMGSQFSYAIKDRLRDFERQLQNVSRFIDLWLTCQRQWLYLYPIFTSPDIKKQMPTESTNFQEVDLSWQELSSKLNTNPNTLNFIKTNENIFEVLRNANTILEKINKRLASYLETKRLAFPRFFFLSNDELLAILSQTRDPRAVQPHLSKCFEGINLLEFVDGEEQGKPKIMSMISSEGETVPFATPIVPLGDTDAWMNMIEKEMRNTLRSMCDKCYMNYNERMIEWNNSANIRVAPRKVEGQAQDRSASVSIASQQASMPLLTSRQLSASGGDTADLRMLPGREGWLMSWPAQLVIAVNQIIWTSEVEDAMSGGGTESLKVYLEELRARISRIVQMVRGNLTRQARQLLSNLLILDVHSRNVTGDLISKTARSVTGTQSTADKQSKTEEGNQAAGINNFGWTSQLRYYKDVETKGILVKQVNTVLEYCWEYLGIGSRLVITPLTDRCYMSLTGALRLNLGGSPQGPAGTGKTETVKDLGKALAIQTVVFNCVHGSTEVVVADRKGEGVTRVPIREIQVGDQVVSCKYDLEKNKWEKEVSCVNALLRRKDEFLYIKTVTGQELVCTGDHPLLVRMCNDIDAFELKFFTASELKGMTESELKDKDIRLVCSVAALGLHELNPLVDERFVGYGDESNKIELVPLLSTSKMLNNLHNQLNISSIQGTQIASLFNCLAIQDHLIPLRHPKLDKRVLPLMRLFGAAHGYSEVNIRKSGEISGLLFAHDQTQAGTILCDILTVCNNSQAQQSDSFCSKILELSSPRFHPCFTGKPLRFAVVLPAKLVILMLAIGLDVRGTQEAAFARVSAELNWANFYHKINRCRNKYGEDEVPTEFSQHTKMDPRNPLPVSNILEETSRQELMFSNISLDTHEFHMPLGVSPIIPERVSNCFPLSCCCEIVSGFVSIQPQTLTLTSNITHHSTEFPSRNPLNPIPKIIRGIRWCSRFPLEGKLRWETENPCPVAKILKERFGIELSYETKIPLIIQPSGKPPTSVQENYPLESVIHHTPLVKGNDSEGNPAEHPVLACSCSIPNPIDQFLFFKAIGFCYNKSMRNSSAIFRKLLGLSEMHILSENRNIGIESVVSSFTNGEGELPPTTMEQFSVDLIQKHRNFIKTKRSAPLLINLIAERIRNGLPLINPLSSESLSSSTEVMKLDKPQMTIVEAIGEPLIINKEVFEEGELCDNSPLTLNGGDTSSVMELVRTLEDTIGTLIAVDEDPDGKLTLDFSIPDVIFPRIQTILPIQPSLVSPDGLHDVYDITVEEGSSHTFICGGLVVHNCSEGLNVASMGRMFTGLAICGAWSCLDEFNRIDIEVLSVVAQQILTIQQAVRAGATKFIFEGREIPLNKRVGTFITMNPGYAGRTELPDNLKALFRPVSMMMPNYTTIAEIMLFSAGYERATNLAEKLTTTLRLSSEQLSAQDHYDFGMRALKAILTAAGELKRLEPQAEEGVLCLRALLDVNLPKFLDQDVPLFRGIISDLFPGVDFPPESLGDIETAVQARCVARGLDPTNVFLNKVRQLISTLQVRHGLMLVGGALSGKSEITSVLAEARTEMAMIEYGMLSRTKAATQPMAYHPTVISRLNPKALPIAHLYGTFDQDTGEWHDGVVANLIRSAAQDDGRGNTNNINRSGPMLVNDHWIVFDGPVDAVWIENMNTVLDDNKKLCLNSGEVIQLSPRMAMLFEVEDLAVASPATVSRCGMVYCETKNVTRAAVINKWLRELPQWCRVQAPKEEPQGDTEQQESAKPNPPQSTDNTKAPPSAGPKQDKSARGRRKMSQSSVGEVANRKLSEMPIEHPPIGYIQTYILSLCDWLLHPTVLFVERHTKLMCPLPDMTLIVQFTRCFNAMLEEASVVALYGTDQNNGTKEGQQQNSGTGSGSHGDASPFGQDIEKVKGVIDAIFIFALIWSVCANCGSGDRKKLDLFVRWLTQDVGSEEDSVKTGSFDLTKHTDNNSHWCELESILGKRPVFLGPGLAFSNETSIVKRMNMGFHRLQYQLPPKLTIYDYTFNASTRSWVHWLQDPRVSNELNQDIALDRPVQAIFIPTLESIRHAVITKILAQGRVSTLICGPTGTSKTTIIRRVLQQLSNKNQPPGVQSCTNVALCFTARTSVDQMQSVIEAGLVRRRKGVVGPPVGTQGIIFADDFNMPNPEEYGAQPPLELVRQWFDDGGWFDLGTKEFKRVVDCSFLSAMLPPGGGRNTVPNRLVHHFNTVCFPELNRETLEGIFRPMVCNFLSPGAINPPPEMQLLATTLVAASADLYFSVKSEVLPTPSKSHYSFNLRDLGKIFQGLFLFDLIPYMTSSGSGGAGGGTGEQEQLSLPTLIPILWLNECHRVICDRLIDEQDKGWFENKTGELLERHFKTDRTKLIKSMEDRLGSIDNAIPIFTNMLEDPESKVYKPVFRWETLKASVVKALGDYNGSMSTALDIVPFSYAVHHLTRICRILMQPQGHALLIGIGGSGRQSLTRLAAFAMGYDLMQLDCNSPTYGVTEWREDIKKMFSLAGAKGQQLVVLFTDSQLRLPSQLEDINNILNFGDVPNLWQPDELQQNLETVAAAIYAEKGERVEERSQLLEHFERRTKDNLHVVLSFSPIGSGLRQKLISFPSLVNCTTIDWFDEWPNEALVSVAKHRLTTSEDNQPLDPTALATPDEPMTERQGEEERKIVDVAVSLHAETQRVAVRYAKAEHHELFVTPAMFSRFLGLFGEQRKQRASDLALQKGRYVNGLNKLLETRSLVERMTVEQEALKPLIIEAARDTAAIMTEITAARAQADEAKAVVVVEEREATRQTEGANKLSDECSANLQLALPKLEAAEKALMTLNKNDIIELKSMKNPPKGVKLVMEAVCVMRQVAPKSTLDTSTGKKVIDYWPAALSVLGDTRFLQILLDYDKENIPEKVITDIAPYMRNPDFTPQKVVSSSCAASGLCAWVRAMYEYHFVDLNVRPMRARLAEARAQLAECEASLAKTRGRLADIERGIASLEERHAAAIHRREDLAQQAATCEQRLKRADTLITGLGGEKERWEQEVAMLEKTEQTAIGDSLLASAALVYAGVFPLKYRSTLLAAWAKAVASGGIKTSRRFSLQSFMGNELHIQEWKLQGLPSDSFSIENAIVCFNSDRYPLMIDPQEQANQWIKNMFTTGSTAAVSHGSATSPDSNTGDGMMKEQRTRQLVVVKPNDPNFTRNIENALTFGNVLLLEDMGTALPPSVVPLATKQFVRQAGGLAVKLGERTVDIGKGFELFMTTSSPRPQLPPEVAAGVTLVNFAITPEGAEDQLLSRAISLERPELEDERRHLTEENTTNRRRLKDSEAKILHLLSCSSGNVLDDVALIETLEASRVTAGELKRKLELSKKTEERISRTRELFRPLAARAATVFFAANDMTAINSMYQYSLDWFIGLFEFTIKDTPVTGLSTNSGFSMVPKAAASLEQTRIRIAELRDRVGVVTYRNVCRSLFAKDKLCFAFSLCLRIELAKGNITEDEVREMLTGKIIVDEGSVSLAKTEETTSDGLGRQLFSDMAWHNIEQLDRTHYYKGIKHSIETQSDRWSRWKENPIICSPPLFGVASSTITSTGANSQQRQTTPLSYAGTRGRMVGQGQAGRELVKDGGEVFPIVRQLHLVHLLFPEAFVAAVQHYIEISLSPKFTKPPQLDMSECFQESKPQEPFVFILSPGADPVAMLLAFAESRKMGGANFQMKSLGQGQGPAAEKLVAEGMERGFWVLLANVHLAASWMPRLEAICSSLRRSRKVHTNFRLFLTSMPVTTFPASILQNALKITTEAPVGIQANMERLYRLMEDKVLGSHTTRLKAHAEYRQLLFNLIFCFASLLERRRFGPLGFNVLYDFNDSDVSISEQQLLMFFEEYDTIPFDALRYITGEINIGGRVTDDKDRLLVAALLEDIYTPAAFEVSYKLSESPLYERPDVVFQNNVWALRGENTDDLLGTTIRDAYIRHINTFPQSDEPLVFGLHSNAAVTLRRTETSNLLEAMLLSRPEASRVVKERFAIPTPPSVGPRGSSASRPQRNAKDTDTQPQPRASDGDNNTETQGDNSSNDEEMSGDNKRVADGADTEEDNDGKEQNDGGTVKEVLDLCGRLLATIPPQFDAQQVLASHPITYEDSMSTVLHQEVTKYNSLLAIVVSSIRRVEAALKGLAVMTSLIEDAFTAMRDGKVPAEWTRKAYPACYPLMEWITNLRQRVEFIDGWTKTKPQIFWFSGLFFPQGFLTGLLQNFARRHRVPIDEVSFAFDVMDSQYKIDTCLENTKGDGTLCSGLFLQGGRWDDQQHLLVDSAAGELFFPMPTINFIPVSDRSKHVHAGESVYECPCYRTPERRGVLTTTGRSSNYILDVTLPIGREKPASLTGSDMPDEEERQRKKYRRSSFWVKHGTALLMQMEF